MSARRREDPVAERALCTARRGVQVSALYARLWPEVEHLAAALLGQKPSTDLVHDICVEITLSEPRFRHRCAFSTWMYAIVSHHAHNWMRTERNQRNAIRAAEQESLFDRPLRPDEVLESFALHDRLRVGFAALTEMQRVCLILVRCESWSSREAAELLDLTPTAVRMHVHRARARLRRWLDERD